MNITKRPDKPKLRPLRNGAWICYGLTHLAIARDSGAAAYTKWLALEDRTRLLDLLMAPSTTGHALPHKVLDNLAAMHGLVRHTHMHRMGRMETDDELRYRLHAYLRINGLIANGVLERR